MIDFIDAEKAYVEGCALAVAAATVWRIKTGRLHQHVRTA